MVQPGQINMKVFEDVRFGYGDMVKRLYRSGQALTSNIWQAVEEPKKMIEVLNCGFQAKMPQQQIELFHLLDFDNLPMSKWSEDHFQERVSRIPYNPPPSYTDWHNGSSGDYFSGGTEKFSHTYPERFWFNKVHPEGFRYSNGNLDSVVEILKRDINTRQAFLPMFLPEDLTASLSGERVPCSLGWHFIHRNGYLHLFYTLRSCDALRHFANDIYMAVRLAQWVVNELDRDIKLGFITLQVVSFHCFENDMYKLKQICSEL